MIMVLEKLTSIANKLDQLGMYDYADQVDKLILASGERTTAVDNFIKELKRIFTVVANDPRVPSINTKNLEVILNVIDTLANQGTFINPSVSEQTFEELGDEATAAAEGMLELWTSIIKLRKAIKDEQDPVKRQELENELEQDRKKFGEIWGKVDTWRNGRRAGDAELYQKWEKIWNERKKEIGF